MESGLLPWQHDAWNALQQLQQRLPHALLFHGHAGIGKTAFAERFAKSLLCEQSAANGHACGTCVSCLWFDQYAHPDYRRVRPEVLDDEDDSASGEEGDSAETKKSAKTKQPSKDIRIDQVRALGDFLNVSTHRQGRRVILLYPAEALNAASANSLLKMLEEPPTATVFLLVSNRIDRLLPTILSRCRKFAMGMPTRAQALAWLKAEKVPQPEVWLAEQGGAPMAAQSVAQSEQREAMEEFVAQLTTPGTDIALKTAERLQKVPVVLLVAVLQRWLYDIFSFRLTGTIRYYPRYEKQLGALSRRVGNAELLQALKAVGERRAIAEHPLSARLFIEDMLLDYSRLFA